VIADVKHVPRKFQGWPHLATALAGVAAHMPCWRRRGHLSKGLCACCKATRKVITVCTAVHRPANSALRSTLAGACTAWKHSSWTSHGRKAWKEVFFINSFRAGGREAVGLGLAANARKAKALLLTSQTIPELHRAAPAEALSMRSCAVASGASARQVRGKVAMLRQRKVHIAQPHVETLATQCAAARKVCYNVDAAHTRCGPCPARAAWHSMLFTCKHRT
jgi:hypothetical protein